MTAWCRYLDAYEVEMFCTKLGLQFTEVQVAEALTEMELSSKQDGKVEFDEFLSVRARL
jgi:hypothetical protein